MKNINRINSLQNEKIKELSKLKQKKYRVLNNKFIVEGENLIKEADGVGLLIETISSNESMKPDTIVTEEILKKITDTSSIPKIIGVCRNTKITIKKQNKIIALENVQDPGNLGTIIRSAAAFGYDLVIQGGVDLYSPKVLRSTQGTIFKVNITEVSSLIDFFNNNSYHIYTTKLSGAINHRELEKKENIAIIFGNEGTGVSEALHKLANEHTYIEMYNNVESLNVGVAASIIMERLK